MVFVLLNKFIAMSMTIWHRGASDSVTKSNVAAVVELRGTLAGSCPKLHCCPPWPYGRQHKELRSNRIRLWWLPNAPPTLSKMLCWWFPNARRMTRFFFGLKYFFRATEIDPQLLWWPGRWFYIICVISGKVQVPKNTLQRLLTPEAAAESNDASCFFRTTTPD